MLACASVCAHAGFYTCIDAQGQKSVSDKPCAADQSRGRVYATPPKPAPAEPAPPVDPHALTPQTPEELEAMLEVRRRAAAERELSKETDAQRHMRLYLEQKEQQRAPAAPAASVAGDDAPSAQDRRCAELRKRKDKLEERARNPLPNASAAQLLGDQQAVIREQMSLGCY